MTEQEELQELRNKVKEYEEAEKQRILTLLHQTTIERDHWKSECHRNIDIGKQIAAQAEIRIGLLLNEISTLRETYARRKS